MFAYCGNNPIANTDSAGMVFERGAGGGGGGGLAYAGPASGHIVVPTTPSKNTLLIPFVPLSTTHGIDELRAETRAIRKKQTQAQINTDSLALAIEDKTNNDAIYYGANRWDGKWAMITPAMTYNQAKIWALSAAISHTYGRQTIWGLYTNEDSDAKMMAWDLGGGLPPIGPEQSDGTYPHYHVFKRDFLGFYKHFHVWFGTMNGG